IELHNAGQEEVSLSGISLSDRADEPRRFVFPEGSSLAAGAYLTVFAAEMSEEPGFYLGFGLGAEGETLTLYAHAEEGASIGVIDSVTFGHQLDDCSIARIGASGEIW